MPDLTLRAALLVAAGAVPGALARWIIATSMPRDFPWGVAAVNLTGSFVIGAYVMATVTRGTWTEDGRLLIAIGFLGAYTTMSTFAFDTVAMAMQGQWGRAALNFLLNPVLCIAAAYAGAKLAA